MATLMDPAALILPGFDYCTIWHLVKVVIYGGQKVKPSPADLGDFVARDDCGQDCW